MFDLQRMALRDVGCLLSSPPMFSVPLSFSSLGFLLVGLVFANLATLLLGPGLKSNRDQPLDCGIVSE